MKPSFIFAVCSSDGGSPPNQATQLSQKPFFTGSRACESKERGSRTPGTGPLAERKGRTLLDKVSAIASHRRWRIRSRVKQQQTQAHRCGQAGGLPAAEIFCSTSNLVTTSHHSRRKKFSSKNKIPLPLSMPDSGRRVESQPAYFGSHPRVPGVQSRRETLCREGLARDWEVGARGRQPPKLRMINAHTHTRARVWVLPPCLLFPSKKMRFHSFIKLFAFFFADFRVLGRIFWDVGPAAFFRFFFFLSVGC